SVRQAVQKGIVVHAIRCGDDRNTGRIWSKIAKLGRGKFTSIAQSGGVVHIATPYDDRLSELSAELNETAVIYGNKRAHSRMARKARASRAAPKAAAADRSGYYSKTGARMDSADILDDVTSGKIAVEKLETKRLSGPVKSMSVKERKAHFKKMKAKRGKIMREMRELTKKRDAYIAKQKRKKAKKAGGKSGFDLVVEGAVKEQAESHGIEFK
ncbi:MAG: hypothetical protein AAGC55_21050, partial [Myxococcota bacterium]